MPLSIILDDEGTAKPAFICDYCDKEITDAFDGNYEWDEPEGMKRITDIKFLHKGCSERYDRERGSLDCNMGIHNLMVYLLNNTKLVEDRLKEAYQNSAMLSQL